MKKITRLVLFAVICVASKSVAQTEPGNIKLKDIMLRDACIVPDAKTNTYYMVGPGRGATVVQYTSKDLVNWQGPQVIFKTPALFWGDTAIQSIWAPEMQLYKGKYYLFATFSTTKLLQEQWLNWRPRVVRGSQILVSDAPTGPFKAFKKHATLPASMMTLDATLWEEDGVPYMVYAHEWVQISNGTIESVPLKSDLSDTVSGPKLLFRANEAPWVRIASKTEGCYVTDAPYFIMSKSGRLFMIWSSFSEGGYTVGTAISESGKLAGPWTHDPKPLFAKDGGHGMLFKTFEGKLMMVLHTPNNPKAQPHIYEIEDTGETLKMIGEMKQ
jgi:GH43 family beta-xylosidase